MDLEGIVVNLLMGVAILWPQPGYIHPDEFFQSVEVVAGDVFNISHLRSWEFQPEMPLRDIVLPYLLFAPGFYALRAALRSPFLSAYIVESYAVLVIPRIVLVLTSFVNYCFVRKLCQTFHVDSCLALWYLRTSFVVWTFLTRPFSNTSETFLFSMLCILLIDVRQCCTNISLLASTARTVQKDKLLGKSCRDLRLCSFVLGVLLCVGVFNRSTFCLFAFVPFLWWAEHLLSVKLQWKYYLLPVFFIGIGFLITLIGLSVANSLYYNPDFTHLLNDLLLSILQWDSFAMLQSGRSLLTGMRVPPVNFIRFNFRTTNLAEHGLHPWYTHLLANFPLLLGPLALLFYWDLFSLIGYWRQKHSTDVLYAAVIVPVLALSLFPHQEARFLLPVLPFAVVCVAKNRLAQWKYFKGMALLFNMLALVLFGWLHQGGIVRALSALQGDLKQTSFQPSIYNSQYHVVSYSTYMLPPHLLFSESARVQLQVHQMIGAHNNPEKFQFKMEELNSFCRNQSLNCHLSVLLPSTAELDIKSIHSWQLIEEAEYCPHLSMERLPSNWNLWTLENLFKILPQFCLKIMHVTM